jgi:hypothetical protein
MNFLKKINKKSNNFIKVENPGNKQETQKIIMKKNMKNQKENGKKKSKGLVCR